MMAAKDYSGYEATGASTRALQMYERGLARLIAWRDNPETYVSEALSDSPEFVMAQTLRAYLYACSRDPRRVRLAQPMIAAIADGQMNGRERRHVAAINSMLQDNYEHAAELLGDVLHEFPRDVLALHVAHALDYSLGNTDQLSQRTYEVLPYWSEDLPGYHAVLSMRAFGLVESGEYGLGSEFAALALERNAKDARAYHALAHAFEMSGDRFFGRRSLQENANQWGEGTVVKTHMWWHMALLELGEGNFESALSYYDTNVRAAGSEEMSDLIDAAALLWRLELSGVDVGGRWLELSFAWQTHIDDAFCSFNDVHAMLAFVGAEDWASAQQLERTLSKRQHVSTRHGITTARIGLPACRAIMAYGRGDYGRAVELLSCLPSAGQGIGGSYAQRDVLYLTLIDAISRVRRPVMRVAA